MKIDFVLANSADPDKLSQTVSRQERVKACMNKLGARVELGVGGG